MLLPAASSAPAEGEGGGPPAAGGGLKNNFRKASTRVGTGLKTARTKTGSGLTKARTSAVSLMKRISEGVKKGATNFSNRIRSLRKKK